MIKLINGEVCDLLLRYASERPGDALGKLNRRIVYSDRHRVLWILRLTWSDFLVVLHVTSSDIHIGKTRIYAHILSLIHRWHRDFITEILVAFEDRSVSRY